MDDDNKPIDASIRPVLPSRACSAETFMENRPLPPSPMVDEPAQPPKPRRRTTRKTRHPLPPQPERKTAVKKKPKDKKRSAIAKAAWQTRRKNAKGAVAYAPGPVLVALELASKLTHEELGGFMTAVAMLQHLPTASRKLVLDALSKVFP